MQLNKNLAHTGFMPLPQGWARRQAKSSKQLTRPYRSSWTLCDVERHNKDVERASQTVLYSNLSGDFLAQPLEHSQPSSLYVNNQIHRKRPRVEDTVNDIIRQAKNNNTDGLSPCSKSPYRPWRSIHDLPSDIHGRRAMASVQSFCDFSEDFYDQKPVDYSLTASVLTPRHHHTHNSSPQFDEWQNSSRLANDCTLLSQLLENENNQPHTSSSARSVSSDCSYNETSRRMWRNPFHPTNHFDPPGNPLSESIYSTGRLTCNNQDEFMRRNPSGWHFWQFQDQRYLEAASSIHEYIQPKQGLNSPSSPSARFRNSQPFSSNHLEPFSRIQGPTEEVPNRSSPRHECRSPLLTKSHLGFLECEHTLDRQQHLGNRQRKAGSLSSSIIADLTKDWSPLAIYRDDSDNARKDRTQSASIQTEIAPATNTAVQTDDYLVACHECKKLRSRLDRILRYSMNRLDSTVSHTDLERFYTSTPRLPSNSSQVCTKGVDIGFISPGVTNVCTLSDFQKKVQTDPPLTFPKNRGNRLFCKGLNLSDSIED